MKNKRILVYIAFAAIVSAALVVFSYIKPCIKDYEIFHDEKYGGVYTKISIEDFNEKGFNFGDSVDVKFSNGNELLDIPYYNGYYVDYEKPLLVGYPGSKNIKIGINYGDDLWTKFNLTTEDTVTIKLNTTKKYLNIQEARDIHYSDEQGNKTDEVFGNFRSVNVSKIKPNVLYRSASPINNEHKRASVVDKLMKEAGIKYIIDLSDNENDIESDFIKVGFNSPYFLSLYNDHKVMPLSMNVQFKTEDFSNKLVKGLTAIANNDGPYLVHCVEGKDRTGFVIMVLEALIGSSYDEMINDYMETYKNYYSITKESDETKYNTIKETNIDIMLKYISGSEELENVDYSLKAKDYLLSHGMKEEDINKLIEKLTK